MGLLATKLTLNYSSFSPSSRLLNDLQKRMFDWDILVIGLCTQGLIGTLCRVEQGFNTFGYKTVMYSALFFGSSFFWHERAATTLVTMPT